MLDWLDDWKALSSPLHLRWTRSFLILTLKIGFRSQHEPKIVPERRLLRKNYLTSSKKCQSCVLRPAYLAWSQFLLRSSPLRAVQLLCIDRWDWKLLVSTQFLKRRLKFQLLRQACLHFRKVSFAFWHRNVGYLQNALHSASGHKAKQGGALLPNLAQQRP